ncbi:unnamed protein product [Heterobilharzia americana]|nr:unnamed protein product [Heterobilharzia americana]CAH8658513.1 unnamed protein product [Heterobilharzia americana]
MIESDYGLCNICFESVPCANMLVLSKCGCSFCRECLTMYVISVLRDRIDISCSCPSYRCSQGGWLTDSEIKELLPSDFYERFSMKKLQREVEQNVNLTFCPAVNCGAVCQISANLNMNLSNGTNPPLKSNRRALKRFCRWYKRRICNSHEHDAPNPKGAVFHDSSGLRIPNISYATSNNTVISKIGDRVTKSLDQSVEQKDLPFVAERGALAYQATPSRPAVRVVCKRCSHEFCARCHLNWHVGGGPYVCEETIENIVHRKKHKKFGTRLSNHQDSCEHLEKNVDTLTAANHIGLYPYLSPETSVRSKLPHTEAKPEYINKLTSLKKPTEKDKIKKISFQRSKTKQSSYSQKHTGIHLFNNDISDNIDVSVLTVGFPPYSPDDWLKRCPACLVPIERIEGCAQMMCRSCKHTFCWYCLTSLDDDFLLQHYDDGACKGKLGHSRASVIGHRVYVAS